MSIKKSMQIICSSCGRTQLATVHSSIHVSLFSGHKEKDAIQKLQLFNHTCSFCGNEDLLAYPSLYHDSRKKLMIWLLPIGYPDEQNILDDILASSVPEGYTSRMVATQIELADKIAIFDSNLDDRVVELCKVLMLGDLCEQDPKYKDYEVQYAIYHKNHGVQHTIMYHCKDAGKKSTFAVELTEGYYNDIKNAFQSVLNKLPCKKYEEVSSDWAYRAIDLFKEQKQ